MRAARSCSLQAAAEFVVGIVTDRDIVLKAVAGGIAPGEALLADVMTDGWS